MAWLNQSSASFDCSSSAAEEEDEDKDEPLNSRSAISYLNLARLCRRVSETTTTTPVEEEDEQDKESYEGDLLRWKWQDAIMGPESCGRSEWVEFQPSLLYVNETVDPANYCYRKEQCDETTSADNDVVACSDISAVSLKPVEAMDNNNNWMMDTHSDLLCEFPFTTELLSVQDMWLLLSRAFAESDSLLSAIDNNDALT